jgi:hypothetical protein
MSSKVRMISTAIDLARAAEVDVYRAAKVDEYGEVRRRLALCAPDEALAKALKDEIEGWHADDPGELTGIERGTQYELQFSARRMERTVFDKQKAFAKLRRALGLEGLIAILDIPFGAGIDKVVPKSEQGAFVSEERSGYRTFTVVPLFAPAAPEMKKAA